MTNNDLNVL